MSNRIKKIVYKVLIFILVWILSMLVIGIIGAFLYQGSSIPGLFAVIILIAPIALATLTVIPPKKHKSTSKKKRKSPNQQKQSKNYVAPSANANTVPTQKCNSTLPHDKTYHLTGVDHYRDNILNLALENDDYSKSKRELIDDFMTEERIWKYNFYPSEVDLVPEPDNLYDPNAIKVIVDNEHVGYIKKGSCKHLLKVIAEGRLGNIDCTIGGGPYKYIYEEYDDNGNEKYEMERDEVSFAVVLHIVEHEV